MSLLLPVSPWQRCHGPCWKSKLIQPHVLRKNSQYFNCASFAYIHAFHWLHCVATYPSAGGRRMTRGCVFKERNMRGVTANVYLRKTSEKPEKTWSTNFKWKVRELYLRKGKVLHPTRPSQETATFNQMWKYDFNLCYLPFLSSYVFFMLFYIFYLFVVDKGVSLCSYVFLNCDNEIRPT